MTDHTQNLMRQLLARNAQAIVQRLLDECVNLSKTHPPVQLERSMCERHWEEIKVIAHYWGGPAPFDYDEVERALVGFFIERLQRLPTHEQATLCMGLTGVEDLPENALDKASQNFELDDLRFGQILNVLLEDLMSFVDSGRAPEDYESSEAEEFSSQVAYMTPRLKYFRRAHQALAQSHAFDIRQRLVAELRAGAKNTPAFDVADEGCRSHWDEICVMAYMGGDHILYSMLLSTLDDSALRAIKALPETEQYALWAESRWGEDWVDNCDWDHFPTDIYTDSDGLNEAAETVRSRLLSSASQDTFFHDEYGVQSDYSEDDDLDMLQAVVDGKHPQMLEPALPELMKEAYLRHTDDDAITALFKKAVEAYTQAMLAVTAQIPKKIFNSVGLPETPKSDIQALQGIARSAQSTEHRDRA
jgi:hypothetical protein